MLNDRVVLPSSIMRREDEHFCITQTLYTNTIICHCHKISQTKKIDSYPVLSSCTLQVLILRQNASYSNHSTSKTTIQPVVKGDGLATLLCMSCHHKIEDRKTEAETKTTTRTCAKVSIHDSHKNFARAFYC